MLAVGVLLAGGALASDPAVAATPHAATVTVAAPTAPGYHHRTAANRDPRSPYLVVDKRLPLIPKSYVPKDLVTPKVRIAGPLHQLRAVPARHLEQMFAAYHRATGKSMAVLSAYRSYTAQKSIYNRYVREHGRAWADRSSARPGFSEHQTGMALDISASPSTCSLGSCFGTTSQGKWLAKNSWKYGYILRYPKGYEKITGYKYEPWHYRYVGVKVASDMHARGIRTLEQYYGYAAAPTYR